MDEQVSTPQNTTGEQRTLASIMFTDVVSFSKHSAINEERTYKALNRDFDLIYRAVAEHNGQVLNTMGDGMMVVFMSAVQCVQCAIRIQAELYRQALSKPADGVLQHRLGLHVGDIILNGKNTMGDGVNQAARIQALARPESIAMSREFHKMVDGKTPFKAKYLGLLRAKNIPEAIPIWEIAPIDDEIRQRAAEALFTPEATGASDGVTGRRSAVILLAVLLLLALASAPIFLLQSARKAAQQQAKENGHALPDGKSTKQELENIKKHIQGNKGADNNAPVANNTPEANNAPVAAPTTLSLNATEVADVTSKTNNHDYAGVLEVLKKATGADSEEGKALIKKYENLVAFQTWISTDIQTITEASPLMVTVDGVQVKAYATQTGVVLDNGTPVTKGLWEYKEATILAIAEALLTKLPSGNPVLAESGNWIASFKEVHKV